MNKDEINKEIEKLKKTLTGVFFEDLEIQNKIHELTMKRDGVTRPPDSDINCEGCGS